MKNTVGLFSLTLLTLLLFICAKTSHPQQHSPAAVTKDSITRGAYTLIFVSNDDGFDTSTRRRMIDAFFDVYPKEVKRFNKHSLTKVVFYIDTAYKDVAETGGGVSRFNPAWLKTYPEDIDVVTHEVMHIVQSYSNYDPGWLTEGIADYVRYVYGFNNLKGKWFLPDYRVGQHYGDSYRVVARFLLWVEKGKSRDIVDKMDKAMREGTYTPELWKKLTGKTVDSLWSEYAQNPAIALTYR